MSSKLRVVGNFGRYFFLSYPGRLKRFISFYMSMDAWKRPYSLLEWILLFFDLAGIPELYQIFHEMFNWKLRGLTSHELTEGRQVFGSSIDWSVVRVNSHNTLICKRYHIAFVSFHTIHFHEKISHGIFIHELMHVWQYENFGSAYIVRALHAQRSAMGYDYGGIDALCEDKSLLDFNFEQMAEIVKDGYLGEGRDLTYTRYLDEVRK